MKKLICALFLMAGFSALSQSQAEMNQQAYKDYQISDQALNQVYQGILSEYSTDTVFIANLKKSQRLWIKLRDAEMAMRFPNYPDRSYGSIHPLCRAGYLKELTEQRKTLLEQWLAGAVEGDACNGSIKPMDREGSYHED